MICNHTVNTGCHCHSYGINEVNDRACRNMCDVEFVKPVYTRCATPNDYKNQIIAELTAVDDCNDLKIRTQVDNTWVINGFATGADLYLQYLYTKLAIISFVQGCYVRQVDTRDGNLGKNNSGYIRRDESGRKQGHGTTSSTSFTDAIGRTRYSDSAYGNSRSSSFRTARNASRLDAYSYMDDVGFGDGFTNTKSDRVSRSEKISKNESTTNAETTGKGSTHSCNYSWSTSKTIASGINLGIYGKGDTATGGNSFRYQKNSSQNYQIDEKRGKSFRSNLGFVSADGSSSRTSSDYFFALKDSRSTSVGSSSSTDDTGSQRTSRAHAEGFGTGQSETRGRSNSSHQFNSTEELNVDESLGSNGSGYSIVDDIKSHQRFLNLHRMYLETQEEIKYYKHIKSTEGGYRIRKMNVKDIDCRCVPANLMVARIPCGYNSSGCGVFGCSGGRCGNRRCNRSVDYLRAYA